MTYLAFHIVFLIPPIVVLAAAARGSYRYIALMAAIALAYTTPWDNYLVYRGIWTYGSDRVLATIGYVPVEEYLFFALQSLLTGLWLRFVTRRQPPSTAAAVRLARRLGALGGLAVTAVGIACLFREETLYLGLILAWAGPVLAGQWFLAGERFMNRAAALGVAVPTVYLWAADRIALDRGIWAITDRFTVGLVPFGLPIEEAVFFLVTNVLVVQGLLMFDRQTVPG